MLLDWTPEEARQAERCNTHIYVSDELAQKRIDELNKATSFVDAVFQAKNYELQQLREEVANLRKEQNAPISDFLNMRALEDLQQLCDYVKELEYRIDYVVDLASKAVEETQEATLELIVQTLEEDY